MANIIDRRVGSKDKSAGNRKKFLDRYKKNIKKSLKKSVTDGSIEDFKGDVEVTIDQTDLSQPTFEKDNKTGENTRIGTGGDFATGDTIRKEQEKSAGGRGGGNRSDEGADEFSFLLTKEEFFDIYFSDMALPDFVKRGINQVDTEKVKRYGYTTQGIPSRLNIRRTFERAIARKIATKEENKKPRYLDEEDLRYNHYEVKTEPNTQAVMFCLMDTSASMSQEHKSHAKQFFLLLYLFLTRQYDDLEIRFIRHTETARETDEHGFFYDKETGGTVVSAGLQLINEIIDKDYNPDNVNIYIAQCSDGDYWAHDEADIVALIHKLLPKIQYFAYTEIELRYQDQDMWRPHDGLIGVYENILNKKLNSSLVFGEKDIYPALAELFRRKT